MPHPTPYQLSFVTLAGYIQTMTSLMYDPDFLFFQLLFFGEKIPEKIFLNEIEFARFFKFDRVDTFQLVRQNVTEVSSLTNICSVLEQALNHSKISSEVQLKRLKRCFFDCSFQEIKSSCRIRFTLAFFGTLGPNQAKISPCKNEGNSIIKNLLLQLT